MNCKSISKLAVAVSFFFSVSSVQGAQTEYYDAPQRVFSFHNNSCLLSVFEPQESETKMKKSILRSPMDKVIDGFISCPDEMFKIFYPFFLLHGSQDLVQAVKNSDKKGMFYEAIGRNSQPPISESGLTTDFIYQDRIRHIIFLQSFLQDLDPRLYSEKFEANRILYLKALLLKSMSFKTSESKNSFSEFLSSVEIDSRIPIEAEETVKQTFDLVNKLLRNDPVNLNELQSIQFSTLTFICLGFNKFDLAEQAVDIRKPCSLQFPDSLSFYHDFATKYIDDLPRAVQFIKSLLPSKSESDLFEQIINENDLESKLSRFGI